EKHAAPHTRCDYTFARRPRRLAHNVSSRRINTKRQCRRAIGKQVDPENLGGEQWQHHTAAFRYEANHIRQHHTKKHSEHFAHVGGKQVAQKLADVGEDRAAFFHGGDNGGKVVIGENHVRCFLGNVG